LTTSFSDEALAVLQRALGPAAEFRDGQLEAIEGLVQLALMRDQIEAASRLHLNAVSINSSNTDDWERIEKNLLAAAVDLLLVSPERFNNPDFRDQVYPFAVGKTKG
jgi:ATP-dependent DNA helicase RecQ